MDSCWTKEKKLFTASVAFREKLTEIIDERLTKQPKLSDYGVSNWAYLRSDQDGYNRALKDITKLLTP